MHPLPDEARPAARELLSPLAFHRCGLAVVAGHAPGAALVDRPERPRAIVVRSPEGILLGGAPGTPDIAAAARWLQALALDETYLVADAGWLTHLDALLAPRPPIRLPRLCYELTPADLVPAQVPAVARLSTVDARLIETHAPLAAWVDGTWRDRADFLARGFGVVALDQTTGGLAAWSLADVVTDEAGVPVGEIGIETAEAYRRRGLGRATAAACAELGFARGLRRLGWHTNDFNAGSRRIALRLGFRLRCRYAMHYAFRDAAAHDHARAVARDMQRDMESAPRGQG